MALFTIPSVVEYVKSLSDAKKWDAVSKNGTAVGKLTQPVKAGFADGRFWIKFQFEEVGKPVILEGSVGLDSSEQVKVGDAVQTQGHVGLRPIALVKWNPMPKGYAKGALQLGFGEDSARTAYRFDVKLGSS
jgi:hypothetical protein